MKRNETTCEHCGAKTVEHSHNLNRTLARGLVKLHQAGGGPIHLRLLDLTYTEQCNFQKLQYWGLVEMAFKSGEWKLTERGRQFAEGRLSIPKVAWTYRKEVVGHEGIHVLISDVTGELSRRAADYAAEARPHR